jgi:hypothetical protein
MSAPLIRYTFFALLGASQQVRGREGERERESLYRDALVSPLQTFFHAAPAAVQIARFTGTHCFFEKGVFFKMLFGDFRK